jgi:site-specific DNA recombinase
MMQKSEGKRVVVYTRVSSEEQKKEGLSLDAQRRVAEDYCLSKGWYLNKVYSDAGISAKSIKGRKAFKQLIIDAKEGKFSAVVITKFDRAFRNVLDALKTLDEFNALKIDFVSISEQIDTTSAMGRAMFTMISAFAQLERELTGERVKAIQNDKFNRGILIGKSPIGYKYSKTQKKFVIDEKKAEIVKKVFEMTKNGSNWKKICEELKINHQTYYNILKNKVYVGFITLNGQENNASHEPLVNLETFNSVQALIKSRSINAKV